MCDSFYMLGHVIKIGCLMDVSRLHFEPHSGPDKKVVVVLLFYRHSKQLRSCPDGQLT